MPFDTTGCLPLRPEKRIGVKTTDLRVIMALAAIRNPQSAI